jgi:hypothetical protein
MRPEDFDNAASQPNLAEPGCGLSESRELIALVPVVQSSERMSGYRSAPFLAQIIATKDQHPQTRERRRTEPKVASAAYRATAALTAA